MLETKEQKQYFVTAIVLVIMLSLVSLWSRGNFRYARTVPQETNQQDQAKAYLEYLRTLQIDPNASKQLFQQLMTKEEVRQEVEQELQVNQKVVAAPVDESRLRVQQASGKQEVEQYLSATLEKTYQYGQRTSDEQANLFVAGADNVDSVAREHRKLIDTLYSMTVPKDALGAHKALLSSLDSYTKLLDAAKTYAEGESDSPWPQVYGSYAAINQTTKQYDQELQRIADRFKITEVTFPATMAEGEQQEPRVPLVKTAHAFLGFGDVTITMGDIPRIIMDAVEEGLASSFARFMGSFIEKLVVKIEQNYLVANYLYYSDALVTGQYADDYLNKYVSDTLDRQIIKKFMPQFNCGTQPQNLRPLFQAKATEYLGFDPTTIDPNDPNYYQKLSRVGSFMASPTGWELYYQDLAEQVKSESEKAVERELTSSGLKTPRDAIKSSIAQSVNSIVSAEKAALEGLLDIGGNTSDNFVSAFIARLTENLMNKFVFRGVTGNSTSVGVLKEQATCMAAAQLQVVIPTQGTQYETPPPAPTEDQLLQQQCARFPRGCDGSGGTTGTRPPATGN